MTGEPAQLPVTLGGRRIGYAHLEIAADGEVWVDMSIDHAEANALLGRPLHVSLNGTLPDEPADSDLSALTLQSVDVTPRP